jgi:phosphoglycolate phosphatase
VTIIFDFDGTIADSFEMVVGIVQELSGHPRSLSPDEVERLRGMSLVHVGEELHFRPWEVPFLLMRGRRRMTRRLMHVAVHQGLPAVIRRLHADGHQLFIVSSNSQKNIRLFLRHHHLSKEFTGLYGGVGLLGKGRMLRKVLRRNRLDSQDTWFVGDEVRDVTAAQAVGIPVVAVTWGFNNATILSKHHPTHLIETPEQLLDLLQ